MSCEITQNDLAGFYGSINMYLHRMSGLRYTDGIHYLEENGAGWLVDAIASYQGSRALSAKTFKSYQFWNLKVDIDKSTAVLTCEEDSGIPPVVTQKISFTDFPFDIKIWVENGVMLLPSEH